MAIFDIVLLLILFGFVLFGLYNGLIKALGGVVGLLLGVYFAGQWYETVGQWLGYLLWGHQNLAKVLAFVLIFIIISRLVQFVFYLINKLFKVLSIVPFLKTINRLLGAILGFIEGCLFIGVMIFFLTKYPLADWLTKAMAESTLLDKFLFLAKVLQPLLPWALKQLQSII